MRKRKNLLWTCLLLVLAFLVSWPKERQVDVFLTGYSYWDNTPPGSAIIARPQIHEYAGGDGTFEDPVTLAVGWRSYFGRQFEDVEPGRRFYIPSLRKYAVVEDLCGDGPKPQSGPCHTGWEGHVWIDVYVDGSTMNAEASNRCMEKLTGIQRVIVNPRPGYRVVAGRIVETGCQVFQAK